MSQDAQIAIYPSVSPSNIGNNIPVFLTVDDTRSSAVLGSMGEGAQMTTSQDLAATIGVAVVNGLKAKGFDVGSMGNQNSTEVKVTLEDLSFSKDGNAISTTVGTTSKATVEVESKGFLRTYSNSEERTIPFSTNEDSNNSQLSSTLGALVEKMLNDQELLNALAK